MTQQDRRGWILGAMLGLLMVAHWAAVFFVAPDDEHQGPVYRIMFLHVPCAFTAFASSLALCGFSLVGLKGRRESSLRWGRATAEVGLMFTVLTLATGSIWGRPTWGTWWTWDARLTTTFLLALLYAGYLLMYEAMTPGPGRVRACGVLGIIIFADVPVIYQSVNWWRTLHQPQSILRQGGSTMDPEILTILLLGIPVIFAVAAWLTWQRWQNLALATELEALSYDHAAAGGGAPS